MIPLCGQQEAAEENERFNFKILAGNKSTMKNWPNISHLFLKSSVQKFYLDGSSEPAAEGVEDAEAVVQAERLVVFTEEVDQRAALLLQLPPTFKHGAQTRGRRLKTHVRHEELPLGVCVCVHHLQEAIQLLQELRLFPDIFLQ